MHERGSQASDKTRGHGHKQTQDHKHHKTLTVRVPKHWHRFPRELVESILWDLQKPSGHVAGQLVLEGPTWTGGWTNDLQRSVPSNLSHSAILWMCMAHKTAPKRPVLSHLCNLLQISKAHHVIYQMELLHNFKIYFTDVNKMEMVDF